MFVTERLYRAANPLFSYEIIPPPRGRSAREILDIVEQIVPFEPPFIDVTSHSAVAQYEELSDGGVRRCINRKRPGTISICAIIHHRYNIDTVPHILCRGFTREETEDVMIELGFLGIHNVLAVRGDETNYEKSVSGGRSVNVYANELVHQLSDLRQGRYLEDIENTEPFDLCIGVCGYPEKHVEAPNLKTDIQRLKQKVEAGADYIVTQMFFDNQRFFEFVDECRKAGIKVPIIPGLKVINSMRQLTSLPKNFQISIPDELADEIQENPKHAKTIGVNWAVRQCEELFNNNVRCIHFFVLNDVRSVLKVVKQF